MSFAVQARKQDNTVVLMITITVAVVVVPDAVIHINMYQYSTFVYY